MSLFIPVLKPGDGGSLKTSVFLLVNPHKVELVNLNSRGFCTDKIVDSLDP